jgi:hypothetical protein
MPHLKKLKNVIENQEIKFETVDVMIDMIADKIETIKIH